MDTLLTNEDSYRKFIETLLNVSIIGALVLVQSLGQIMAVDDRIAHVNAPQIDMDTGTIKEKIVNVVSPAEEQKNFSERVKKKYPKATIVDVDSGVKHIKMVRYYNGKPVRINVVELDTKLNNSLELRPALASNNTVHSRNTITTIAKKEKAIVAINGTFFKPQTGVPLGTLMINNKMYTGPVYDRVAMGIFNDGNNVSFDMARLQLNSSVKADKTEFKIDNINQPRMLSTYMLVYTPLWGKTAPISPKYGMQISVENNKVTNISSAPLQIPQDGYVIVGPQKYIAQIALSKKVELTIKTTPEWKDVKHIISGGPYLVKNGETFVDMTAQRLGSIGGRNPRTAIGYTENNDFVFVAVDGREGSSVGLTLNELSKFMKSIGCINAMNLDGGGSTVMYVNGKVVNKPAMKGGIALSNAVVLASKEDE